MTEAERSTSTGKAKLEKQGSRILPMDQMVNLRDAGGLPVVLPDGSQAEIRRKALLRSARPDEATPEDIKKLLEEYQIITILDLRSAWEAKGHRGPKSVDEHFQVVELVFDVEGTAREKVLKDPPSANIEETGRKRRKYHIEFIGSNYVNKTVINPMTWLDKMALAWHFTYDFFMNYFSGSAEQSREAHKYVGRNIISQRTLVDEYFYFLEHCQPALVRALRMISERKNHACLVNCAHGKDRTGVTIAFSLLIAGVPEDVVAHDYGLTREGMLPWRERTLKEFRSIDLPDHYADAQEETMHKLLERVKEKYGSINAYLDTIGFDEASRDKLRRALVDL
eukprot:Clim_evm7s197 gene=Clim_evmTU7s197